MLDLTTLQRHVSNLFYIVHQNFDEKAAYLWNYWQQHTKIWLSWYLFVSFSKLKIFKNENDSLEIMPFCFSGFFLFFFSCPLTVSSVIDDKIRSVPRFKIIRKSFIYGTKYSRMDLWKTAFKKFDLVHSWILCPMYKKEY